MISFLCITVYTHKSLQFICFYATVYTREVLEYINICNTVYTLKFIGYIFVLRKIVKCIPVLALSENDEFKYLYWPDNDTCIHISRASRIPPCLLLTKFSDLCSVYSCCSGGSGSSHVDQQGRRWRCVPVCLLLELLTPVDLSFDI